MNRQSTLFLLFKEYSDTSHAPSRSYINGEDFPLGDCDVLMKEFDAVVEIVKFFGYERKTIYYDIENFAGLVFPVSSFPYEYPGIEQTFYSQFATYGIEGMSFSTNNTNLASYQLYGCDVTDDMLGCMANLQCNDNVPCVLVQQGAISDERGHVRLQCGGCQVVELDSVSDIPTLHKWFSNNRIPKRSYHYNEKHGDATHKSQLITDRHGTHNAAQLLSNENETCRMLHCAVGVDCDSALWYYDSQRKCFIYFENEGFTPQLGFHAYHLCPQDDNFDNIDIDKLRQVQPEIPRF